MQSLSESATSGRQSDLIVVLGMHRSGTSVTTRAMEAIGADFGDKLMPAAPCNEKGFFEDSDLVTLNAELMKALGLDWDTLPSPDITLLDSQRHEAMRAKAIELLRARCEGAPVFALKDPRLARLLPFWLPIFDELDTRVLYAVPFRHPISVARSLEARDRMPSAKAYMLWLAHIVPALRSTESATRVLVNYDRLMESPREALTAMSKAFGLELDAQRVEAFERDFLDTNLRHTTYTVEDLDQVSAAPSVVKDLFRALVALADTPSLAHQLEYEACLERAEAYLRDIEPIVRYEWRAKRELELKLKHARRHPITRLVRRIIGRRDTLVALH
jgi:hypothetical protein